MSIKTITEGIVDWFKTLVKEYETEGVVKGEKITADTKPGILVMSNVLVTEFLSLEEKLNIEIPNNCYPFYNYKTHKQRSILEAAEILSKRANYAK